jgi:cellulose synthase/poly-beta-1,6-N-acetylglucosamine synthase-like glycosyltransferase
MDIVFWSAIAILAFTYLGYPVVMGLRARRLPKAMRTREQTPTVDVLLVVHDAAELLAAKVANLLALDYPADRLRINIACDGCTDATESVARECESVRVRVFAFAERRGKSACIGHVLPQLDSDIVLFTDVRQAVDRGAARALVTALSATDVGAASGELVLDASSGYAKGIDAYWRYEKMIRRFESASGSLVGVTGALYAARRLAIKEVPAGVILDDMWIPLAIADAGFRIVFEPLAIARDRAAGDPAAEEIRKRRTLMGNYQLLHRWPRLAIPGAHPLAWRLWGHKWLRLLAPWLLLLALVSNLALALTGSPFYVAMLGLQVGSYALAVLARRDARLAAAWPPARMAAAFLSLNLSALLALTDYLRNPNAHLWQTTPCSEPSP